MAYKALVLLRFSRTALASLELQESNEGLSNQTICGVVAQPLFAFLELQAVQDAMTDHKFRLEHRITLSFAGGHVSAHWHQACS